MQPLPDLVRGAYDRITPLFSRLGWLNISPETFQGGQMSMEKVLENTGSILGKCRRRGCAGFDAPLDR